jgi:hypothetical protein
MCPILGLNLFAGICKNPLISVAPGQNFYRFGALGTFNHLTISPQ